MVRYAENTTVSCEKSRAEIETVLARYGADAFGYRVADGVAQIEFVTRNRAVRFTLPLPSKSEEVFWSTPARNKPRSEAEAYKAWEQACRQRWRALALAIKAKLEAVSSGISEFEQEFLAQIVDPGSGRTVGEIIRPQLESCYQSGKGSRLLGLPSPVQEGS